jgi:hypothetical protein
MNKTYLGDSVYADWDGLALILATENGCGGDPTNAIIMEPDALMALLRFLKAHGWETR